MIGGLIAGSGQRYHNRLGPGTFVDGVRHRRRSGGSNLEIAQWKWNHDVTNDNWKPRPDGSRHQVEIEATTVSPTNDLESATVATVRHITTGHRAG